MNIQQLIATVGVSLVIFLVSFGALYLFVKKRDKCSCAAAKQVMREVEARKKATRTAEKYDAKSIDAKNLPILPDHFHK